MSCSCAGEKINNKFKVSTTSNPETATIQFISPVRVDTKLYSSGEYAVLSFSVLYSILSVFPMSFIFKDSKKELFLEFYPEMEASVYS